MHAKGMTICSKCGKAVLAAPGHCELCGEVFPVTPLFCMSDYSKTIGRVAIVLQRAA